MGKILGIDLGPGSLGWSIIDEENQKILNSSVHIFPEAVKNTGTKKEKPENAARTEFRQARRQNYRRRMRRIKLLETLQRYNMCPINKEELDAWKKYRKEVKREFPRSETFLNWIRLNPYPLRAKALKEKISLEELGRVFYHLIQRRGFKSGRKSKEDGTLYSGNDTILGIDSTKDEMVGYTTLGEYLNSELDKKGNEVKLRGRYTLRAWYVEEFNAIWNKQCDFHNLNNITVTIEKKRYIQNPESSKARRILKKMDEQGREYQLKGEFISEIQRKSLYDFFGDPEEGILFFQRPLRSQKHLLSNCRFENSKKPCPISHPEFEEFRTLQFVNNIEYSIHLTQEKLYAEHRDLVYELINNKYKKFNFEEIKKKLKLTEVTFNYPDDTKVTGNYTRYHLKKILPANLFNDRKILDEIWHCLHFYTDNEMLSNKLKESYNISIDPERLKKILLKDGYSNISLKAIRNINPFLKMNYTYSTAVIMGGVKNALGELWDFQSDKCHRLLEFIEKTLKRKNKEGEAIELIKEYLIKNFPITSNSLKKFYHHSQETEKKELNKKLEEIPNLRNPVVQTVITELKRTVNSLSDLYLKENEHFSQIKVELARELKLPKDARQNIEKENKIREELNDQAKSVLDEFGLAHTRNNLHKYILFKEIEDHNGTVVCPYTNKSIGLGDLFGENNQFQIEHIIPYSISLDDSLANKTLCDAVTNRDKGEKTPYQFYFNNPDEWEEVSSRAFRLLPYLKAKRFTKKGDVELENFISRQLNETRYISKAAKEFLQSICDDVMVLPGKLTSDLRQKWGLNSILSPPIEIEDQTREGACWLELNEQEKIQNIYPQKNVKPCGGKNGFVITVNKRGKEILSRNTLISPDLFKDREDGKYWVQLSVNPVPLNLKPLFNSVPKTNSYEVLLKGRVTKTKTSVQFSANMLPKAIRLENTTLTDKAMYWAKLSMAGEPEYSNPESNKKVNLKANQISIMGDVNNNVFTVTISGNKCSWPCEGFSNGKWKAIVSLDLTTVELIKCKNTSPDLTEENIVVEGRVHKNLLNADLNHTQKFTTENLPDGKYYAVFKIKESPTQIIPCENPKPVINKQNRLVSGEVKKSQNSFKFHQGKNREDHRHHAIDAIVIALTQRRFLQELSTWNANKKKRFRAHSEPKLSFEPPWEGFRNDVIKSVNEILVTFRPESKPYTKGKKKVKKAGQTFNNLGFTARGQLHKETVYGLHEDVPVKDQSEIIKTYRVRKDITTITSKKQVHSIADPGLIKMIENRLEGMGISVEKDYKIPSHFFFKNGDYQFFSISRKGKRTPIKKVRLKENIGNAVQLKKDINQYVNPKNNHHVLIYRDKNNKLQEDAVTLWDVVKRGQRGEKVYELNNPDKKVEVILRKNDLYILGLTDEEFEQYRNNRRHMSHYLYRVQQLSSHDYVFRKHTEATRNNKYFPCYLRVSSFKEWENLNPIKVNITIEGEITKGS